MEDHGQKPTKLQLYIEVDTVGETIKLMSDPEVGVEAVVAALQLTYVTVMQSIQKPVDKEGNTVVH